MNRLWRMPLIAILVVFALSAPAAQPVKAANAAEIASLTDLYNDLGGPGWTTSTNWLVGDPCTNNWYGITCNASDNVIEIDLGSNNLLGNIQDVNLSGLTSLERLYLDDNQIGGNIDGFNLTGLTNLIILVLRDNQIGGNINGLNLSSTPNLASLILFNNQIGGSIDGFNLAGLSNLQYLEIHNNQITGDPSGMPVIPASLWELWLSDNQLNGTVLDLTGTSMPPGTLHLCGGANVINPSGSAVINNFAQTHDTTGWTSAAGCGTTSPLAAAAACNGNNLDIDITTGDFPFDLGGVGSGLPQTGVGIGTHTLTGPGSWTGVTVTETGAYGDGENTNLGDFTCVGLAAVAVCNGADLNVTITSGSPNFNISANDPIAAPLAQNNVSLGGPYTLTSTGGYGTWTNITIDELSGDTETLSLPDVTCNPPTPGGGGSGGSGGAAQAQVVGCNATIDVEADREVVNWGDQVVWTVLVTNPGPDDCQGVQTYGTMPGEFSITDINTTQGSVVWAGGPDYIVELGTILANGQATVTLDSLLQGGAAFTLPEGAAGQSAGQQICLTGHITDPVNDTDCVMLFPDTLPATGGELVSQPRNWGWVVAAGMLIIGLGGCYALRRRAA